MINNLDGSQNLYIQAIRTMYANGGAYGGQAEIVIFSTTRQQRIRVYRPTSDNTIQLSFDTEQGDQGQLNLIYRDYHYSVITDQQIAEINNAQLQARTTQLQNIMDAVPRDGDCLFEALRRIANIPDQTTAMVRQMIATQLVAHPNLIDNAITDLISEGAGLGTLMSNYIEQNNYADELTITHQRGNSCQFFAILKLFDLKKAGKLPPEVMAEAMRAIILGDKSMRSGELLQKCGLKPLLDKKSRPPYPHYADSGKHAVVATADQKYWDSNGGGYKEGSMEKYTDKYIYEARATDEYKEERRKQTHTLNNLVEVIDRLIHKYNLTGSQQQRINQLKEKLKKGQTSLADVKKIIESTYILTTADHQTIAEINRIFTHALMADLQLLGTQAMTPKKK